MRINKILLTGATGFLGNHFLSYLAPHFDVTTFGRSMSSNNIHGDFSKKISSIDVKFDMVLHLAGKAHSIPKTKEEEKQFFDINFEGTKNLCNALKNNKPNTFIFISTISVYGKDEGIDIDENEPLNGQSSYAKSKIEAEKYLQMWCGENEINLVILRLPLIAGKNTKGNLESMINGVRKGYYFNIKGNKALKSVVLADDVARLIPNLYAKNGVYNLSGEQNHTFEQIAKIISVQLGYRKILKLHYVIVLFFAKIGDYLVFLPINSMKLKKMMSSLTVSCEKAIKELRWAPHSLIENFKIN